MVIAVTSDYAIGEHIDIDWHPVLSVDIYPPQPVVILKEVDKVEFRDYWRKEMPKQFSNQEIIHGQVPDHYRFYRVSTD